MGHNHVDSRLSNRVSFGNDNLQASEVTMKDSSNISSSTLEDLAAEHSEDLSGQTLKWLAQMSRTRISVLLHELFEQIDEALFVAAGREKGEDKQNHFAEGLREVRRQREAVVECFCARMAGDFESFRDHGHLQGAEDENRQTPKLADPDVKRTFAEMQSKAEDYCFRALNELNQHLGDLRGEPPIQLADNPLSPGNLCRCFGYSIGLISTEPAIKLTICRNFDRYVVTQLQFVLNFINDELRKLSKLKESAKPKRQHHLFATIKSLLASKRIADQQDSAKASPRGKAAVQAEAGVPATKRATTDDIVNEWFHETPEPVDSSTEEPPITGKASFIDPPSVAETPEPEPEPEPEQEPEAVKAAPEKEVWTEPSLMIVEHRDELDDDEPLPELTIEPSKAPLGVGGNVLNEEWMPEIQDQLAEEQASIEAAMLAGLEPDSQPEAPGNEAVSVEPEPQEKAPQPVAKRAPLRLPPLPPLAAGEQRVIFTGDILAILDRMQKEAISSDPDLGAPISSDVGENAVKQELLTQLAECRDEYASADFSDEDEGTIDLVDLVFDFVLHDHNLPGPLQDMLAQLQYPYLRVALLDWQLFALADHPARKLLDELARAALGWSAETDKDNEILRRLEIAIDRIMNDFSGTQEVFLQLFDSFGRYMHRFERRARESEKLALEALQQRQRLKALKQSTVVIGQLMAGKPLPDLIDELLRRNMPEIMVSQWLDHGADSVQWQESAALVEDLIESASVQANAAGLAELETLLPILSNRLNDCLDALDYEESQKDHLFDQLEQMYKELIGAELAPSLSFPRGPQEAPLAAETTEAAEPLPEAVEDSEESVDEAADIEADEDEIDFYEAAQLILGTAPEEADEAVSEESLHEALAGSWFEFKDENQQPVRAKLSWAQAVGSKYLFVDQNGETIADKTLTELAAEVKAGKAMILESIPLFERALGAIADRLQKEQT
jgi:hypothetical protein